MPHRMAGAAQAPIAKIAPSSPKNRRERKKTGIPTASPIPKQTACRLVRPRMNFSLMLFKSFGIRTTLFEMALSPFSQCALNTDLLMEPVRMIVNTSAAV